MMEAPDIVQTYKYSIEHLSNTMTTPLLMQRILGIRIDRDDTPFIRRLWVYYYTSIFLNLFLGVMLEILKIFEMAKLGTFEDLVKIFQMLPCVGYVFMGMTKTFNIAFHTSVFDNVVHQLRLCWPRGNISEEEYKVIHASIRPLTVLLKVYCWSTSFVLFFFSATPFVNLIRRGLGQDVPLALPFFFWFPFDPFQRGAYEVVLCWQTILGSIAMLMVVSSDCVFFIFLSQITMQFELISVKVRKLFFVEIDQQLPEYYPQGVYSKEILRNDPESINFTASQWERLHEKQLIEIIARHRLLIRLAEDVESMFSFSVLVNCTTCSINVCFCGFCVVIVEKWYETLYKCFLITSLTQMAMLCWYGQALKDASTGLADALYNSGWYQASKKIKSFVFIMILRAQKEVHMTAHGFTVISLDSYTKIVKSAWSYFMLILNVYSNK